MDLEFVGVFSPAESLTVEEDTWKFQDDVCKLLVTAL
jgi:hypothetical protein